MLFRIFAVYIKLKLMKMRALVFSVLGLVGCSVAGAFAYAEHRAAKNRGASAAVCAAVPLGVNLAIATESIKSRTQVRFDEDFGSDASIVALKGPAYCYCKLTLGQDGMVGKSEVRCQH
jgi:hypothetical protein